MVGSPLNFSSNVTKVVSIWSNNGITFEVNRLVILPQTKLNSYILGVKMLTLMYSEVFPLRIKEDTPSCTFELC